MRIQFKVFNDDGTEFEGETVLVPVPPGIQSGTTKAASASSMGVMAKHEIDYSLNERNFAKRYAVGMTGARIFTLLVAYIAKGEVNKDVPFVEVERLWGVMTSIFKITFNRKYPTTAKTDGWVNSTSRGVYSLTSEWKRIFDQLRLAE